MIIRDEQGNLLSEERMIAIQSAFAALKGLSEYERGHVLCWFCRDCNRFIGPGESCSCKKEWTAEEILRREG